MVQNYEDSFKGHSEWNLTNLSNERVFSASRSSTQVQFSIRNSLVISELSVWTTS
jgi:hypothetical protein